MRAWRICRRAYPALDGEGARLAGGRWNGPGRPAVYAATSLSLAALEYLVHLDPDLVPDDLVALTIEVPDDVSLEDVSEGVLPADWCQVPSHPACRAHGDRWLQETRSLVLRVPAAPVPEERNLILNPRHPEMAQVRVVAERAFHFDPRLLG